MLYYFLLLSIILNACQSRHYGHLSKVRVKQKQEIKKVEKSQKEIEKIPLITLPEEELTVSPETKKELLPVQNKPGEISTDFIEKSKPPQKRG